MANVIRINSPFELSDYASRLSRGMLNQQQPTEVVLYVLQPLADASVLASCSTYTPSRTHNLLSKLHSISQINRLDIQPLTQAWTQACIDLASTTCQSVTFSMALPSAATSSQASHKVDWDRGDPRDKTVVKVGAAEMCVFKMAETMSKHSTKTFNFKLASTGYPELGDMLRTEFEAQLSLMGKYRQPYMESVVDEEFRKKTKR